MKIHEPKTRMLRGAFLFFLRHVISPIGRLCLGHPGCYRSLSIYTDDFARRERFAAHLRKMGFTVREQALSFGRARLFVANKPQ